MHGYGALDAPLHLPRIKSELERCIQAYLDDLNPDPAVYRLDL
jgi:hypothetical protein